MAKETKHCCGKGLTICCLIGDCSINLMMCCPLSTSYVYRDPTTNQLINEEGHILPEATKVVAVCVQELQAKYGPAAELPGNETRLPNVVHI